MESISELCRFFGITLDDLFFETGAETIRLKLNGTDDDGILLTSEGGGILITTPPGARNLIVTVSVTSSSVDLNKFDKTFKALLERLLYYKRLEMGVEVISMNPEALNVVDILFDSKIINNISDITLVT